MGSTLLAVRAVSSEYVKQTLKPLLLIGIAVYVVLVAVIIWIAVAVSPWWLLLGVIPSILFCAGLAIWVTARIIANRIAPSMNGKQRRAARKVVGRINSAAEQMGTPRFVMFIRIIKDILFPPASGQALINELVGTPGELKREFEALRKLF